MSNIINNENIDKYIESINGNYYESVKLTLLNILEVAHPNLIKNNKVTQSMLDEISERVVEDDEFNDYVDSMIYDEINKYLKNNALQDEEENVRD